MSNEPKKPAIKLVPVASSQLKAIGYDKDSNTLAIEFNSGGVYHYANFTEQDWQDFQKAESKGSHFYRVIKKDSKRWPYSRQPEAKKGDAK